MKVAILGAGNIANMMAQAVTGLGEDIEAYAVAARDLQRAEEFAKKWGFARAYGSYEEMLADPRVDLVYVETPHSMHYEHAKLCLEHGKAVLCEKAFTQNASQARELIALAEEKHILLAEAIWTRYMPSRKMISDLVEVGTVGRVTSVQANLGYVIDHVERMRNPLLAGGAVLDLAVYPINFALMAMESIGSQVIKISADGALLDTGVDSQESITLTFEGGQMAFLYATMLAQTDREGLINGDKGYLEIQNINNCEEIRVYDLDRRLSAVYSVPEQINGYEYEVLACQRALAAKEIECPEMPHSETLRVMEIMDEVRAQLGVIYPNER